MTQGRKTNMNKKDLKNGMVVKTREGGIYLVCEKTFIGIDHLGWSGFGGYYNDLTTAFDKLDIVAVYQPTASELSRIIAKHDFDNLGTPVWNRG